MISMANRQRVTTCFCIHLVRDTRLELDDFIVVQIDSMGMSDELTNEDMSCPLRTCHKELVEYVESTSI